MALPPLNPVSINGKNMSYFMYLTTLASPYLKEYGVSLNFDGYNDTIEKYHNLEMDEYELAWTLAKELNAWSEYFADVSNVIQKIALDAEAERVEIQSISSIANDSNRVSNGDRLSNKEPAVINAKRKRNALKAFNDELQSKISFLERGYYHCKATHEAGMKTSRIF